MSDEILVSGAIRLSRYGTTFEMSKVGLELDQGGAHAFHNVQSIGTTEEQLSFGEVTPAQSWIILRNADSTNYVEFRYESGGVRIFKLEAGEISLFRLGSGIPTLYGIANTAAVLLEYLVLDEGAAAGGGGVPSMSFHTFLDGDLHTDTEGFTPTLGAIAYANATPKWTGLAGQTTTTRKFLRQTGTGSVSAAPAWDTLVAGDIPDLSATYQPLDSDLTAIAALSTTSYGRAMLTLANEAALGALLVNTFQPLDSDLTAIAALTTASYGRSLLETANEGAFKALVNLEIGTDVQAYDADLTTWASLTPSANAQSLVTAANYAAMRALLDLEAGTDFYSITAADAAFQPKDSDLTAIAALTTQAYGRSLLETASEAAFKALVNLEIGTDVQGYDAELAALAALANGAGVLTNDGAGVLSWGAGGTAVSTNAIAFFLARQRGEVHHQGT